MTKFLGKKILSDEEENLQDLVVKKMNIDHNDDKNSVNYWPYDMHHEDEDNYFYLADMQKNIDDISFLGQDISNFF